MEIDSRGLGTSKRKRSPPPSLLLQSQHPSTPTFSYEASSLLSFRLPSPSIHWNVEHLTTACCASACEVDSTMPKPTPSSKWNFTADHLADLCFQLDDETKTRCGNATCSQSSGTRTITPVPSLAFSQTSCSSAVESEQASSPTELQFHKVIKTRLLPISKEVKPFRRSSEAKPRVVPTSHETVHGGRFQASSPSSSTLEYEQYHRDPSHRSRSNTGEPPPRLPTDSTVVQRASEVSFIDWGSDEDEDNGSSQLSRVNARFKRSLADLRPSSRSGHRSPIQYKEFDNIKFSLSVVRETPSVALVSCSTSPLITKQNVTTRLAKRNVTSPGPDNAGRRFGSSKPSSPKRTTVIGYETFCEMSDQRESFTSATQPKSSKDGIEHKDKRQRLSKLSQWVKRRVPSSSK